MASEFCLAAYIIQSFDCHFSLVYFSGIKYIIACQMSLLAGKMRPNARQLDNGYYYLFTMSQLEVRPVIGTFEKQAPTDTLLNRFSKSDDSPLRLTLLFTIVFTPRKNKRWTARKWESHLRNHGLTPSEKKTLVAKRLILR